MVVKYPKHALPTSTVPSHVIAELRRLAERRLPVSVYVYDLESAAQRARTLREALPNWAEVFYAVKANSFPPILQALAPWVDGYEVSSVGEVDIATSAAAAVDKRAMLVVTGPGKTISLLSNSIENDVEVVNVESVLELHRLARIADEAGQRIRVALRVNPAYLPLPGNRDVGASPSPFGIVEADIPAAVKTAQCLSALDLVGFHIHAITNNLDAVDHVAYIHWCLDWSRRTAAELGIDLRIVDCGGGIGVGFDVDTPFDLERFSIGLRSLQPPDGVRALFEPGRWLVANSGYYVAEVTDVKYSYGTWFAVLRGGINHFRPPIWKAASHNFTILSSETWKEDCARPELRNSKVTISGELCTSEDTLARDVYVERIRPGDLVVFPLAGAYGWECAMHEFLAHPIADRIALRTPDQCLR
jgi:diaminopimelate decarboxylase